MSNLANLSKYIKDGILKPNDIIKKAENDVKLGKTSPESLTFLVKYLAMVQRLNNMPDNEKYIPLTELIDLGLYNSIEDIFQTIDDNKDNIKIIMKKEPECEYPQPSDTEIKQNIDSTNTDKICIICTHRKKMTFFIPCGHSIMCTVCSKQHVKNGSQTESDNIQKIILCPLCRTPITKINRIYI
jgi:hypothetical protein